MKKVIIGAIVSASILMTAITGVGAKTVDSKDKQHITKTQIVEVKRNDAKLRLSDEPTFPGPLRMYRSVSDEPTFPGPLRMYRSVSDEPTFPGPL